tara:strand:- start:1412 stop:1612 length:201 start_codon:yes stop_codon:yes gene_type:complete
MVIWKSKGQVIAVDPPLVEVPEEVKQYSEKRLAAKKLKAKKSRQKALKYVIITLLTVGLTIAIKSL